MYGKNKTGVKPRQDKYGLFLLNTESQNQIKKGNRTYFNLFFKFIRGKKHLN